MKRALKGGFALPTVLIASVIMLTVLISTVAYMASLRSAMMGQFYDTFSRSATEAGEAYAKACLEQSDYFPAWTSSRPLTPFTDCSGFVLPAFGGGGTTGHLYYKNISIQGQSGAGSGYQVLLKIGESTGSTNKDFHLEGSSASFPSAIGVGGDLDFSDTNDNPLSFWVEKVEGVSPNRTAYVWVKVVDSLDSGTVTIKCYFGHNTSTNRSNGTATFMLFDDFSGADGAPPDTTKWGYVDPYVAQRGNGTVQLNNSTNDYGQLQSRDAFGENTAIKANALLSSTSLGYNRMATYDLYGVPNESNRAIGYASSWNLPKHGFMYKGLHSRLSIASQTGSWRIFETRRHGSGNSSLYINGVQVASRVAGDSSTENLYVSSRAYQTPSYIDWIFVRKYVVAEPSFLIASARLEVVSAQASECADGYENPLCGVAYSSDTLASSFTVGAPTLGIDGRAIAVTVSGYTDLLRASSGLTWRRYTATTNDNSYSTSNSLANILIVGGGGSGGGSTGGGGGGGGVVYLQNYELDAIAYNVVVGAGGAIPGNMSTGRSGSNSSFGAEVAIGGGGGSHTTNSNSGSAGKNGGSGGGGTSYYNWTKGYFNPGLGTSGQGYNGGPHGPSGTSGGGGAGGDGYASSLNEGGGNGGAGAAYSISGISVYYGGGGGGGGGGALSGTGGVGGGGNGGNVGSPGVANTGGGGGGGWRYASGNGGAGGSGIVIISYPNNAITATGGSITYTDSSNSNPRSATPYSGGYTIHTFRASGVFTVLGNIVDDGLVAYFDGSNSDSLSPNIHPYPTDIYRWADDGNNVTLSRDSVSSPVGSTPLKMVVNGDNPYLRSYGVSKGQRYLLSTASSSSRSTWTVSVWAKADSNTTGSMFIFGSTSDGTHVDWQAIPPDINITTEWNRFQYTYTITNPSVTHLQVRLDGAETGGSGRTIWWDGLQVECNDQMSEFNPVSVTRNIHPSSNDIYSWVTPANHASLSRDASITSPVGNTPMKMQVTGNDPYTRSYSSSSYNLFPAKTGKVWNVSVWAKANVASEIALFIFGSNSAGTYLEHQYQYFDATTEWQLFSFSYTMTNASTEYVQVRLDGPQPGAGQTVWFDGLRVYEGSDATLSWNDLSGQGNDALFVNDPYFNEGAITLSSGTNSYAIINPSTSLDGMGGNFTTGVWVHPTTIDSTWRRLLMRGTSSSHDWFTIFSGTSPGKLIYKDSGTPTNTTLSVNNWYYVTTVYDGGTAYLFINGVQDSSNTVTVSNSSKPIGIGSDAKVPNSVFSGKIGEVQIYNRSLDADEVLHKFEASRPKYGI
jgi:hypothetical protein